MHPSSYNVPNISGTLKEMHGFGLQCLFLANILTSKIFVQWI